ncbi:hypothetical protein E4U41_002553, partial [Claviceps citrina]
MSAAAPPPNPRDSMKSTWRTKQRHEWNLAHWFYEVFDVHPQHLDRDVPVHAKTDKVPHLPSWLMHRWVLVHAAAPLVLHQLVAWATGRNLTAVQAFVLYAAAFKLAAVREMHQLRREGHRYGFLDGDRHARDGVPDVGVWKVMGSLVSTSTLRPLMMVALAYRAEQTPLDGGGSGGGGGVSWWWWLPLEAGLYALVLDFWFYWYHRAMHELAPLWPYHRTHHLTKHPNPLLTLYADTVQELFDMAAIPLLAYLAMRLAGLPMGFYDWWVCGQYVVFAEVAGHSGLR